MPAGRRGLVVLGWHNVEGTWCFPSGRRGGPAALERQLRFLRRAANVVPLADGLAALADGRPLSRAVAITFDDGYADNLRLAAPLLDRLALPATFFLAPGFLSGQTEAWWEVLAWAFTRTTRSAVEWEGERFLVADGPTRRQAFGHVAERLKRRSRAERERSVEGLVHRLAPSGTPGQLFLDWAGARELARRPGVAIGSHSMHHAILSEETAEDQHADLRESRRRLEDELSVEVTLLAYPNGGERDFDATTVSAAEAAGYLHALTMVPGVNRSATPVYGIRRFLVQPEAGRQGLGGVARSAVSTAARSVARRWGQTWTQSMPATRGKRSRRP